MINLPLLLICLVFILCGVRMVQTGSGNIRNTPGHQPSPAQRRRYRAVGLVMSVGAAVLAVMSLVR